MEEIRKVYPSPYQAGAGPRFRLTLWDAYRTEGSRYVLKYRFEQLEGDGKKRTIFEGEDFRHSPMHAIDSDETVSAILGVLTMRKGDTDAEYFDRRAFAIGYRLGRTYGALPPASPNRKTVSEATTSAPSRGKNPAWRRVRR